MLLATGESRFGDLIERTLYNAVLSGVSLGGDRYFYVNPLASNGEAEHLSRGGCIRKEWHLVACCPPNVMRQLATFGHYIATRDAAGLQIHQYAAARITADLGTGPAMVLRMETAYPWEGPGAALHRASADRLAHAELAGARLVRGGDCARQRQAGFARIKRLSANRSRLAER